MIKIGIYVLTSNAKKNYKKECFNTRLNAGLAVIADMLRSMGYMPEYVSSANVHNYDVVLISITSDCDWWEFVKERLSWQKGNYKVIVGGQGTLNVRPFLSIVDYFVLGRAENCLELLINTIDKNEPFEHQSVIDSRTFNPNKNYYINQADKIYPYDLELENGSNYHEDIIGCNHKCLFCGYTWHRKFVNQGESFNYSGLWSGDKSRERAIIDLHKGVEIDYTKLRTTAIDGMSERLRFTVNKKITREMLQHFIFCLHTYGKPHQVKFYNIVGYPNESEDDYLEFIDDLKIADAKITCKKDKQTSILLHSKPFRAMPATAKYFNIEKLFGRYKYCDLPTKYLKTYANLDLYFK